MNILFMFVVYPSNVDYHICVLVVICNFWSWNGDTLQVVDLLPLSYSKLMELCILCLMLVYSSHERSCNTPITPTTLEVGKD